MKSPLSNVSVPPTAALRPRLPLKVALWLLDQPRIGQAASVKRFAGNLLKAPARQGVVVAQSRLGQLLCCDCDNTRDRRIDMELLRQAARAGDQRALEVSETLAAKSADGVSRVIRRPS